MAIERSAKDVKGIAIACGRTARVLPGYPNLSIAVWAVSPWLATGFVALILSIPLASNSFAQSSTSLCDLPDQRGTAMYNKYCGSGAGSAPASGGGGVTPQQQMMLNGASDLGYALGSAFAQWLFSPAADQAQEQREAYMQELQRQREEAEREQKVEQARQLQAMYDRLTATMKLHGLPDLHFKLAGAGEELNFKSGDQSNAYGIPGLPGIYTGGPRDGQPSVAASGDSQSKGLTFKLGDGSTASNGNGYGIPGLPGIYTNGARADVVNASPQSPAAPDFSKMTPDQAAQMARAVSSFPIDQQEKLLAAAQGPAPTPKLEGGDVQARNVDSPIASGSQQSVAASNSPAPSQLASIANTSRAASTALTPEEASSGARTGFDTPAAGNMISAKPASAKVQSAEISPAARIANVSPKAEIDTPALCPTGFISDDGACKPATEVLPLTRDPAIAPGAPIFTAGLSQQCSILATEISTWSYVARLAVLASDVYAPDSRLSVSGFERVGDAKLRLLFPFSSEREIHSVIDPGDSGYRAAVYRDFHTGIYYIAYRGTRGISDRSDWEANIRQALIGGGVYYDKAIALAQMMARAVGIGNFEIVGHSLGGGLGNAAGYVTGAHTTVFNPAGVRPNTVGGAKPSFANNIESYVVSDEPLSSGQNNPISPTYGVVPQTSGRVIVLPVNWSDAPLPLTVGRHKMDTGVEPAINDELSVLKQASRSANCMPQARRN